MKIPLVHKLDQSDKEEVEIIEIELPEEEYSDDLDIFDDPKSRDKFVTSVKFHIRKSYEYKQFIKFLKNNRAMHCCGVHNNITKWDGFSIEIHHAPLTITDIINVVISKRLKLDEDMKMSSIAKEVMTLHFAEMVGLYPLCDVCHTYAHGKNTDLFIPLDCMYGDVQAFMSDYKDYIPDLLQQKFDTYTVLDHGYNIIKSEVPPSLMRKMIYVKGDDNSELETISQEKLMEWLEELNKSI